MHNKQFHELAIGNVFRVNGNIYIKQSSRTGWRVTPSDRNAYTGNWADYKYFKNKESVELLLDNRFSFTSVFIGQYQVYFCGEYVATGIDKLDAINKAIAFNVERMKAYN